MARRVWPRSPEEKTGFGRGRPVGAGSCGHRFPDDADLVGRFVRLLPAGSAVPFSRFPVRPVPVGNGR